MRIVKTLFVVIFIIMVCTLYIQNQDIVSHVFHFKIDMLLFSYGPIGVYNIGIISVAFVSGVLFTLIFGALRMTGKSSEIKSKEKRIKNLEKEITHLEKKAREKESSTVSPTTPTSNTPFKSPN